MKKSFNIKKKIGRKNVILSLVALVLIMLTFVSVSYSWIEEISNVELNTTNGENTPLHVDYKPQLKSDMVIKNENTEINLADYFYEGGNMHLSGCYSDGENFKFPKSGSSSTSNYREGTKDDADTNYMTATFKVTSNGAPTSYWIEKIGSTNFFKTKNYTGATYPTQANVTPDPTDPRVIGTSPSNASEQYMRMSITVNGATTVYAFNSNGTYKTAYNTSCAAKDRKPVSKYQYYEEQHSNTPINSNGEGYWKSNGTNSGYANQGTGGNLNGNTLFTVNKDKTATVTVKIWLEQNANVTSVDISEINLKLTSSWAKTRRIYVRDCTVDEYDFGLSSARGEHWLTTDTKARLYFAIEDKSTPADRTHWLMTKIGTSNYYYADIPATYAIPAVYNGMEATLYRCGYDDNETPPEDIWNHGSSHSPDINYWDKWSTAFPNTFHDEVFSVYSHDYATWDTATARNVKFVDSAEIKAVTGNHPHAYLWDHNTEYGTGQNDKVVMNHEWPGTTMTPLNDTTSSQGLRIWAFYYSSVYDRAVFNDGVGTSNDSYGLQTQNCWLRNDNNTQNWEGKYFDMACLDWFNNKSELPTYTQTYVIGDFTNRGHNSENTMTKIRMIKKSGYCNTGDTWFMTKVYVKSDGEYFFKIYDQGANKTWGRPSGWSEWAIGHQDTMREIGSSNAEGDLIWLKNISKGIYRIYYDYRYGTMKIEKNSADNQ